MAKNLNIQPIQKPTEQEVNQMKELTSGNVVKLEQGQHLEGEFVSCDESAMYKDSYAFKVKDGEETKTTFVNNVVKDLLDSNAVKPGDKVRVLFKGMKSNKSGTAQYKDYSVFLL